jgi:ribosomal protein S27E
MVGELGKNIFQIRPRSCRKPDGSQWKTEHGPFILDEDGTTVECGTCGDKLNPMSVLVAYARRENGIAMRFESLKLEVEKAQFKAERQNRVRCEHCSKLTRIRK